MDINQSTFLQVCFTLVFILMVFKKWYSNRKGWGSGSSQNLLPGPWKLPLIGHLHLFISSLPHHCLRDLAKKHGSLMHLKFGELSHIIVSSPKVAQQVFKTHDINFVNRPFYLIARIISYDCSNIIFAPYGAYWRQLRKICTLELFSAKRVQSFRSIREEQVSNLIHLISSNVGLPVNLGKMLSNLSYNITLKTAFSGRSKQHEEAFISILKKLSEDASGFSVADLFPSMKWLYVVSGMRRRLERLHQHLDEMLERVIEEHRAKKGDDVETDDLVDVLLNLQDHGNLEFPLTTDNIKAVIQDIIASGTDTSAITIEWAMSEMIRNPRVMKKAQMEVRQVFDRRSKDAVNESNIHELKYLKLVIKETLRLHPPGPLLARENVERCEINGYEIPAKSKVVINMWGMGRDPKYWNEPERFYPERFLNTSIDYKGTSFQYIPFGAGRRICPGISYGMAIVELSLANLLYHFDWKLPNGMNPENLDMTEAFGAIVRRKTDLCLIPIPYERLL